MEAEELKLSSLDEDEAFLRRLIFPEEDRHRFTATPWRGGYRWFRSANVVCIEHYRTAETKPARRLRAS
jgi:hypothetical protein